MRRPKEVVGPESRRDQIGLAPPDVGQGWIHATLESTLAVPVGDPVPDDHEAGVGHRAAAAEAS